MSAKESALSSDDQQLLYQIWVDASSPSVSQFNNRYHELVSSQPTFNKYTKQTILNFVKTLGGNAHVQIKPRPRKTFPITSDEGPFFKLMVDLMDLRQIGVSGYLMLMIDVRTRYLCHAMLRSKSKEEVHQGFLKCFKEIADVNGFVPDHMVIIGDKESAWNKGRELNKFYKENDIETHFSDEDPRITSLVERVIRTLRGQMIRILKHMQQVGERGGWKERIDRLIFNYNHLIKHKTLNMTPFDAIEEPEVSQERYEKRIQKQVQQAKAAFRRQGFQSSFNVGDKVHYQVWHGNHHQKKSFIARKGARQFSQGVKTIVAKTRWGRYMLSGIENYSYSADELQLERPVFQSSMMERKEENEGKEQDFLYNAEQRRKSLSKRRLQSEGIDLNFSSVSSFKRIRRPVDYGAFVRQNE